MNLRSPSLPYDGEGDIMAVSQCHHRPLSMEVDTDCQLVVVLDPLAQHYKVRIKPSTIPHGGRAGASLPRTG